MDNELESFYNELDRQAIEDGEAYLDANKLCQLALDSGILEEIDEEEYRRRLEEIPF